MDGSGIARGDTAGLVESPDELVIRAWRHSIARDQLIRFQRWPYFVNLHADLSQPVVLDTNSQPWIPSPIAGVERRTRHGHGGGEEILGQEGLFEDEWGTSPPGTKRVAPSW